MGRRVGHVAFWAFVVAWGLLLATVARAVPYAAFVMDARTGEVIYSENAETPLHPASLTKMMTLYVAFQAIQRGEITLDTEVRIPADAAAQPPSRLGLREGQTIRLRYLLRAAAVKSANDAATAIGYAIAGSQPAMAERMNAMAAAMGMTGTRFVNMNGLTAEGHYSTARDMSLLGRHLVYDFPQYYNLFSRRVADAGVAEVANTNRRFLDSYEGADGIKTGYTVAAGYNLVASAQRGEVRIIATVFGGTSTADRNARVADLLDMGFAAAPARAIVSADPLPQVAAADAGGGDGEAGARAVRVSGMVERSLRPGARPADAAVALAAEVAGAPPPGAVSATEIEALVAEAIAEPEGDAPAEAAQAESIEMIMTAAAIDPGAAPLLRPDPEVVTRVSSSGGGGWGVDIGRFPSRDAAERALIQLAIAEAEALQGGVRRVDNGQGGWAGTVVGLSRDQADLACRRLAARSQTCFMLGAEG